MVDCSHPALRSIAFCSAMEAVTFIGMNVGAERFRNDAKDIVNMFAAIMSEPLLASHPSKPAPKI
jgi:hypothetical protein